MKPEKSDFFDKVFEIVKRIPYGKVTTYGSIGLFLGAKSSARMVGWAVNSLKHSNEYPCHRVVNRNGELTGRMHFETPDMMRELLENENVSFIDDHVDLSKHLWEPE